MIKRFLTTYICAIFLFSTSINAFAMYSPEDNITESKVKFQQLSDKIMETNLEISDLNTKISKLADTIDKNSIDIHKSEKQIETEETQMEELKDDVANKQQLADKRIRALYKNRNSGGYISILLTSESFSDFLLKYEATERIAAFDKKILSDLKDQKEVLSKNIANLNMKHNSLEQLKNSNIGSLQQLNDDRKKLKSLIKQFDEEKVLAALVIKENEEKLIAHSLSVIDSQNSTITIMKDAISTLKSLLPQLNTASIKKKAQTYISDGGSKLAVMVANSEKPTDSSDRGNGTYKATYTMIATAYTGHSMTSMGLKPVRDPDGLSTIAVDPKVIPLGTKVYIPGYGYAICADTGGSIKGNKIDIFLNSEDECYKWGRRTVTLHIIAYPGEW